EDLVVGALAGRFRAGVSVGRDAAPAHRRWIVSRRGRAVPRFREDGGLIGAAVDRLVLLQVPAGKRRSDKALLSEHSVGQSTGTLAIALADPVLALQRWGRHRLVENRLRARDAERKISDEKERCCDGEKTWRRPIRHAIILSGGYLITMRPGRCVMSGGG